MIWLLLAQATSGFSASVQTQAYRLATGERIKVAVFGEKELAGNFFIDGIGNIFLPLIGEVSVAGLTITECKQRLTELIADGFVNQPAVSVSVAEYRPIYVLGYIKSPGSYPFRFGLSALSAISLSGGFGTAELKQGASMAELLLADERLKSHEVQRAVLLIRLARLEAEYHDKNDFDPPESFQCIKEAELASTIEIERQYLTARREALRDGLDALLLQKPRIQAQITATNSQMEAESRQGELVLQQISAYKSLAKKGLARLSTQVEYQRERTRSEATMAQLRAELSRLDVQKGEIDVKVQVSKNAHKKMIMDETLAARSKLKEIETILPTIREIRRVRNQIAGYSFDPTTGASAQKLIVWRSSDGKLIEEEVGGGFLLEPGDILEVRSQVPEFDSRGASAIFFDK